MIMPSACPKTVRPPVSWATRTTYQPSGRQSAARMLALTAEACIIV
jgi:hypothetical protein